MKFLRPLLLAASLAVTLNLLADKPPPDLTAEQAELFRLAAGLKYQSGKLVLHDGLAKLTLPENYRYLSPPDAAILLGKLWGNPGNQNTLGIIVPAGFNPFDIDGWAVVITYDEDGYVKDDDAAKINYTELLQQMKDGAREASKERVKAGYPAIELIGWASAPRYDASAHKLYWAKEIKFGQNKENTLNYNIRMLGRRGVLVLNAVAPMQMLPRIEAAAPTLLSMVDFQEGHRYADFNGDTDKVATYGLAALVAGGIAAKTGVLKLIWVGILAFKKFIFVALLALAGYAKRIWAWIRGRQTSAATIEPGGT